MKPTSNRLRSPQPKAEKRVVLYRVALLTHVIPFLLLFLVALGRLLSGVNAIRTVTLFLMALYPLAAVLCGAVSLFCDVLLLKEKRNLSRIGLVLLSLLNLGAGLLLLLRLGALFT